MGVLGTLRMKSRDRRRNSVPSLQRSPQSGPQHPTTPTVALGLPSHPGLEQDQEAQSSGWSPQEVRGHLGMRAKLSQATPGLNFPCATSPPLSSLSFCSSAPTSHPSFFLLWTSPLPHSSFFITFFIHLNVFLSTHCTENPGLGPERLWDESALWGRTRSGEGNSYKHVEHQVEMVTF